MDEPLDGDDVRLVGEQLQLAPVVVDALADDDVRQRLADVAEARRAGPIQHAPQLVGLLGPTETIICNRNDNFG